VDSVVINALLAVITQIAPNIGVSKTIQAIIDALIALIPILIKEYQDIVPIVQSIIADLKSNAAVTPEQMQSLEDLEAKYDADFEAAVAMPDSSGVAT
jgi:hypothetical protein